MTSKDASIKIPGYRIIRQIGEGGMSVVYLAFQESLKREVALKIMRPVIADEVNVVKRFKQEAEIIAKLYHPNIVSIYDVGSVDEYTLFYAMPYLQHGDLTGFAYHNDEELIKVMSGLCQGFAYAHAQGVVHRDIKPENILFDQFGNVKIADFGIALSSGRRRFTKDQRIVGSIHYLSPEQARSKHVDARSDIYGLGAILYEILTGKPVFDAPDDLGVMMAHVDSPIPRLPNQVAHWQNIIDRCLAKSPNQRFQSMQVLQKAIEQVTPQVNHGPIRRLSTWPYLMLTLVLVVMVVLWLGTTGRDSETSLSSQQLTADKQTPDFVSGQQSDTELVTEGETRNNPVPQLSLQAVNQLLSEVQQNIDNKQLTTPKENNALDKLLKVLADQPQHAEARALLSEINDGYFELAYQSVLNNHYDQAEQFAESVTTVRHKVALVNDRLLKYLANNSEMTVSLLLGSLSEQVRQAVANHNRKRAKRLIDLTDVLMPGHRIITELNELLLNMPESGQVVTDRMGVATVLISPPIGHAINYGFYVTPTEVTVSQYRAFREATDRQIQKCQSRLQSNLIFSGRNLDKVGFPLEQDMPVVCVTWQDAVDYAEWLSEQTGHTYRLPTEAEWQLLKQLTIKPKTCGSNNVAGIEFPDKKEDVIYHECDDGYPQLAPVRAFTASDLGVYGIYGNASEWLKGCEKPGKLKTFFGSDKPCEHNPVVGLSWLSDKQAIDDIQNIDYGDAFTHIGFRLIRQ